MLLNRGRIALVALGALLAIGTHARAAGERVVGAGSQEKVNLTIYNGGNSLVHDRRRVQLEKGQNRLAWRDVSGDMDATSAILSDLTAPGAVAMLEQNFNYDLLKPSTLLDKYVGRDVTVVHDRARPGFPAREKAQILADNDGLVLQYADRIETNLNDSHLIFASIPENLRDRPTLVLDVDSAATGNQTLDLAYLTSGLGWHADYVGVVANDERHMNLNGLVTLTNTTGTTYANARLQLVAGSVNVVEGAMRPGSTIDSYNIAAGAPRMQQENYFEYHLYTLGRPTTVANAQTKQVALLSAENVPIRKTLELRGSSVYYYNKNSDLGAKLKVRVYITFTNKGGDLGVPLPGGVFRLYKNDSRGTSQFLGSDRIDHTPRDQDVRLNVGESFDVTANKKQTDFKGLGHCTFESTYKVAVSNAKDQAEDVLVVEPIPGTWSIEAENFPHEKTSSFTATWNLHVPARKTTTLEYTARVALCF
ncbi:MAG TPA: hypothetical protein VKG44_05685 [Candidatus Baltobacteraceae bacterium]|nr:hypothetical protein [Candidatus Baltobacteraceae bacterium]